jgi:hypothetical protein
MIIIYDKIAEYVIIGLNVFLILCLVYVCLIENFLTNFIYESNLHNSIDKFETKEVLYNMINNTNLLNDYYKNKIHEIYNIIKKRNIINNHLYSYVNDYLTKSYHIIAIYYASIDKFHQIKALELIYKIYDFYKINISNCEKKGFNEYIETLLILSYIESKSENYISSNNHLFEVLKLMEIYNYDTKNKDEYLNIIKLLKSINYFKLKDISKAKKILCLLLLEINTKNNTESNKKNYIMIKNIQKLIIDINFDMKENYNEIITIFDSMIKDGYKLTKKDELKYMYSLTQIKKNSDEISTVITEKKLI